MEEEEEQEEEVNDRTAASYQSLTVMSVSSFEMYSFSVANSSAIMYLFR